MWAFLTGGLSSLLSGFIGPLFTFLNKKQDVTLEGFKTASGYDLEAYKVAKDAELAENTQKSAFTTSWFGPKVAYLIVAWPAALHVALIFIDSSFTFGSGHYGNLSVPKLPPDYFTFEQLIVGSLFIKSTVSDITNKSTFAKTWLGRK